MSDVSRPGYRAERAIAEYAAFYSTDEAGARQAIDQAIADVRRAIDNPEAIINMTLNLMSDPAGW
jgi:hypothetical protein